MRRGIAIFPCFLILLCQLGCAITDYEPWPGHKTQGDAKLLFDEIAFTGFDPNLDGTYAYSVNYDHSSIPIGAFPSITITSWHNNGGTIVNGVASPPAFNPDGLADRLGNLNNEFGSFFFVPPWTKDAKWGKFFVAVDTDGDCQFFDNVTQDFSGSPTGPGTALCFGGAQEETGDIVELESFKSLDQLVGRIFDGSLGNAFSLSLTSVAFASGGEHKMINPLSVAAPASAEIGPPEVSDSLRNDVSAPVSARVFRAAAARPVVEREGPSIRRPKLDQLVSAATSGPVRAAPAALAPLAAPLKGSLGVNVLGVGVGFPNYFVPDAPTDVNLAVGDTQVVQWVNVSFAVFDKATGRALTGPIDGNALWSGFGGRCETHNDGDIIAQWDKLAHRWVLTQNVFGLPYLTCIAISTTADATGSYFRYAFANNAGLPDYPKWGLQADAYYQTQNAFSFSPAGARYLGAHVCAFDRANMLVGRRASQICFTTGTFDDSMLPADLDSARAAAPRQPARNADDDVGDGRATQPQVILGSIDTFDPSNSNTVFMYLFNPT